MLAFDTEKEQRRTERHAVLLRRTRFSTFSESSSRMRRAGTRDSIDASFAMLGADDGAARFARDFGELGLSFGREVGGQRLAVVVLPNP